MAYNFPNNPSNGDTVTVNNLVYTYVAASNKWKAGAAASTYNSDIPPSNPASGDLWFNTSSLNMFVYYDDGGSAQWVEASPSATYGAGLDSAAVNNLISSSGSGSGGSGSGTTTYDSIGALPLTGNSPGDMAFVDSADKLFIYNGAGWYTVSIINATPTISSVVDSDGGTTPFYLSTEGATTVITITASDTDGFTPTYGYSVTAGSLTNGGGTTATVVQDSSDTNVFRITPTTTEDYAGDFTLTFTASDGINTGTSANEFSLLFAVANSKHTALLLKADADEDDTQVDASTNAATISKGDNPFSTALTPFHPKGYSLYLPDNGNDIYTNIGTVAANTAFTLEFWVQMHDTATETSGLFDWGGHNASGHLAMFSQANGIYGFHGVTGLTYNAGYNDVWDGAWHHICIQRDASGSAQTFIDGTVVETFTFTAATGNDGYLKIGGLKNYSGYGNHVSFKDFRVVDGTQVYNASGFTPPTKPLEAISGTIALLGSESYFVDKSTNGWAISTTGTPQTRLESPYNHVEYSVDTHRGSVYFDGSNDYLTLPASSNFAFGIGDFTVEFWIYLVPGSGSRVLTNRQPTNARAGTWSFNVSATGCAFSEVVSGEPGPSASGLSSITRSWAHFAAVRESGTTTIYRNGKSVASAIQTTNFSNSSYLLYIMASPGENYTGGYLQDVRIVKGTAVYTAEFTPPTEPLTAISGTQLLTCTNKNDIWDAASGGLPVTVAGNTTASTTRTKYDSASIYLDGSGDYARIKIPEMEQRPIGTRDHTVEFWFNSAGTNSTNLAFFTLADSYAGGSGYHFELNSGTLKIWSGNGPSFGTCPTFSANTWHHIAVVSEGGDLHCYFDGTEVGTGILGKDFTGTTSYPEIWLGAYSNSGYGTPYSSLGTATYFEDLRVTLDVARYTANFTPPTAALKG